MVHLFSRGFVIPVVTYIKNCLDKQDTDISLIRHFVTEVFTLNICILNIYLFLKLKGGTFCILLGLFSVQRETWILYKPFIDNLCRFSTSSPLLTLQSLGSCFFPWSSVKTSQIQYDRMMEVTLSQSSYVRISYTCTCIHNVKDFIYHLHVHVCVHSWHLF